MHHRHSFIIAIIVIGIIAAIIMVIAIDVIATILINIFSLHLGVYWCYGIINALAWPSSRGALALT
jgi:hypothetical protein